MYLYFSFGGIDPAERERKELQHGPWLPLVCLRLSDKYGHKSAAGNPRDRVFFLKYTQAFEGPRFESSKQFVASLKTSSDKRSYYDLKCPNLMYEIVDKDPSLGWVK